MLRRRYEQDKARKQVSGGLDLVGQPSRKLIAVTQYCEVDKPLKIFYNIIEYFFHDFKPFFKFISLFY